METHVDERPTTESVLQFHELLQAEMDTIVHSTPSSGGEKPVAKALQTGSSQLEKDGKPTPTSPDKIKPCKFWGTPEGCRHAKSCRFAHATLPDARERCWLCSSKEHRKIECPYGRETAGPQAGGSGGKSGKGDGTSSTSTSTTPTKSGNGKGKNGGGKSTSTSSSTSDATKKDQGLSDPKVAMVGSASEEGAKAGTGGSGESNQGDTAKKESDLMDEVTTLLRSLRAAVRVCSIKRISKDDEEMVLLDGGATHCLRSCESEAEWSSAVDIKVTLAEGETLMKQLPDARTLLTKERVQPIVPVSMVATLGYKISWTSDGCRIHHPERGNLPITMVQGCPTVPSRIGRSLMKEIEEWHKQQCRVRSILAGKEEGISLLHSRLESLRNLFPEVPLHLLQQVPGKIDWNGSKLTLSRRQRRSVEKAKTLVIYAFSGPNYKDWLTVEEKGVTVLCLDLLLGHNLLDPDLCGWLEHVIETRGVDAWLLSPPCRTTSICRHRDDDGPPPLRGQGAERFGKQGLKPTDQLKTDGDSILWLKSLYWMWLSNQKNPQTKYLLENPRDPNEWHPSGKSSEGGSVSGAHGSDLDGSKFPSFWQWPESETVKKAIGLMQVHVEQGALEHPTVKPTTLLTNMKDIIRLQGLECDDAQRRLKNQWPKEVEERIKFSKGLAEWAPGLKQILRTVLVNLHLDRTSRLSKLTPSELQEIRQWEEHVARGHCPYRRDCAVCVETRGRDRKHTRQDNVDAFCLSLDVSGPYEVGVDQSIKKPRYYITGNLTVPVCGEQPLVEGLRELGLSEADIEAAKTSSKLPLPSSSTSARPEDTLGTVTNGRGSEQHCQAKVCQQQEEVGPRSDVQQPDGQGEADQHQDQRERERDPFQEVAPDQVPALTEAEVQEFDVLDLQWKELVKSRPQVEVTNLTQSLPLRSRSPKDILEAVALMMTRFQSLRVPIARIHTDRAREFCSQQFRRWVLSKGLQQSTTAGDEPATNGRCEQELGIVRGMARAALRACGGPANYWPLALRHASETRMRDQLRSMGVPCPPLLPLGLRAMAKQKRWHKTSSWESPNTRVQLWGPCQDMSMGAGGYFAALEDGRFIRTTAIIVPRWQTVPKGLQTIESAAIDPMNSEEVLAQLPYGVAPVSGSVVDQQVSDGDGHPAFFDPNPETGMIPQDGGIETGVPVPEAALEVPIMLDVDEMALQTPAEASKPPLRHRLHGKHTVFPDGQVSPALRKFAFRAGGEVLQYVNMMDTWMLAQQKVVGKLLQGMISELQEGADASSNGVAWNRLQVEQQRLEASLKTVQTVEDECNKQLAEEVLQTKTISMQEVRENYMDWVKPFAEEYSNLTQTVITPLDQQQLAEVMKNAVKIERVPGKLVATLKPPAKQRGRIVACGNFMSEVNGETSASGLDCIGLRAVLRKAADQAWSVSSLDVRRAFLNAPRLEQPGHVTLVDPPALLQKMGITKPHEVWQVRGALYGLCESPRDWSVHRDKTLRSLRWRCGNTNYIFKESGERNLWKICDESNSSTLGYLCVYVDDLLLTGPETVLTPALEKLQATWECSQPEWVNEDQSMRFCGFEIQQLQGGGLKLWQPSYIQDLIEKHEITGEESTPCPKVVHGDTEVVQPQVLHQAQMFTGELQWIQSRTRPDLAYVCGLMSRLQHRRPSYVIEIALHTLRYLKKTWNLALNYRPCKVLDWGDENQLQCPRAMNQLEVYADSSFSLEHEEDRSVQGIVIEQAGAAIQWSSSRQPFVAASTAESELISYAEAHQQALSVGALLQILEYDVSYILYGDNRSALSLATSEAGPWRTRHLKLRASRLRDDLRTDQPDRVVRWSARHLPGELLVADGLTKALIGPSFLRFLQRLGLEGPDGLCKGLKPEIRKTVASTVSTWREKAVKLLQAGALLKEIPHKMLAMVGQVLLAIGSWCLSTAVQSGSVDRETSEGSMSRTTPRLVAMRAPGDQLPVRPTRGHQESQAGARGRAACPPEPAAYVRRADVPGWWDLKEVQQIPRGKDRWVQEGRWLIRVHGEPRRRSFHPVHRSCPVDLQRVQPGLLWSTQLMIPFGQIAVYMKIPGLPIMHGPEITAGVALPSLS